MVRVASRLVYASVVRREGAPDGWNQGVNPQVVWLGFRIPGLAAAEGKTTPQTKDHATRSTGV